MSVTKFPDSAVTTNARLESHLRASLREAGVQLSTILTWAKFKEAGDCLLRDSDPLGSVEFGVSQSGNGTLSAERDEHGIWQLKEGR